MTIQSKKDLIQKLEKEKFFNVRDELQSLTLEEIKAHQPVFPYAVAACNVTGSLNIGTMVRTATIFGAMEFMIFGRKFYDKRSTVGAENYIPVNHYGRFDEDALEIDYDGMIEDIIDRGYAPVFVEGHARGRDVSEITASYNPCFIFGNEGVGIPNHILDKYPFPIVSIDQPGVMRSLNVAVAAGIVMNSYHNTLKFDQFRNNLLRDIEKYNDIGDYDKLV